LSERSFVRQNKIVRKTLHALKLLKRWFNKLPTALLKEK
jgi:hypothetical protein